MSFDLYFYKATGRQLTENQVAEYLTSNVKHNKSEHPKQWLYENPVTGVYFTVDWNEPCDEPEEIELFESFLDFESLNFSVSINFFRPRFFGFEVFPLIEDFISDLDLFVLNPQDEIDPNNPGKFGLGYLQEQWIRHNDKLALEYFHEYNLEFLSPSKSDYLWWYQTNHSTIENMLNDDIFVPSLILLKSKADGKLYTACVWAEHLPIILPVVDYVIVGRKYRKFSKKIEESGFVSYKAIMDSIGDEFKEYKHEVEGLKVLSIQNSKKVKSKFNNLKLEFDLAEFGELINFDGFVNVCPEN